MPKVSIVIPIWGDKYKQYLEDAIDSANSQTFKDFEVILEDTATDLATARNRAIKRASGEYILPLDADDMIDCHFLEKTVGVDDIVGVGWWEFGDENRRIMPDIIRPTLDDFKMQNRMTCTSLFKREIWEVIGGYDESMKDGLEDWDFWLRALRVGYTVTMIPQALFFYRKHGRSMITDTLKKHDEIKKYMLNKLK